MQRRDHAHFRATPLAHHQRFLQPGFERDEEEGGLLGGHVPHARGSQLRATEPSVRALWSDGRAVDPAGAPPDVQGGAAPGHRVVSARARLRRFFDPQCIYSCRVLSRGFTVFQGTGHPRAG